MAIRLPPALAMAVAVTAVVTPAAVPAGAVPVTGRSKDTTALLDRFATLDLGPGRRWG
ncbi:hypothetical protein [Kitasatospora sp. NPDC017646]|uniref:hypothetical protein n=1 Tax=Kitasatospora sp. NPDC017646 TaxID=3364024 RepID=UPI0037A7838D